MVICCVVASESLLTYDPVRSGGIPHSAWHLTIPEQAPPPQYSDTLLGAPMTAWLKQPGFLSPYGTLGADMSYVLAVAFTVLFLVGWRFARRRRGQAHHVVTLSAMAAMLAYFVAYYVNRGLGALAFEGEEGFGGPPELYESLFRPLLTFHILVVTIGLILAVYMIVLGFRTSVKRGEERGLVAGSPRGTALRFTGWALLASVVLPMALFGVRGLFTNP